MNINGKTKIFGIIGDPIEHSLSPIMHNAAFNALGLNFAFIAFNVKDIKAVASAIKTFGIKGLSVTIPHKIEIMKHLDKIDKHAAAIGAVNTVINENGVLSGYNTDYKGAIEALLSKTKKTSLKGKKAIVLGAGGAARAIIYGLLYYGAKVAVVNRSQEKGKQLAKDFGADFLSVSDIKKIDCDIIINTTSVGMSPHTKKSPIDKKYFEKNMIVMDIVYSPLETRFLKEAKNAGCEAINGLSMFLLQGAAQFELFTEKKAPIEIMKRVINF